MLTMTLTAKRQTTLLRALLHCMVTSGAVHPEPAELVTAVDPASGIGVAGGLS